MLHVLQQNVITREEKIAFVSREWIQGLHIEPQVNASCDSALPRVAPRVHEALRSVSAAPSILGLHRSLCFEITETRWGHTCAVERRRSRLLADPGKYP